MGTNVMSNVESVNIPKFIPQYKDEPFHPFFEHFRSEIERFSRVSDALSPCLFLFYCFSFFVF